MKRREAQTAGAWAVRSMKCEMRFAPSPGGGFIGQLGVTVTCKLEPLMEWLLAANDQKKTKDA